MKRYQIYHQTRYAFTGMVQLLPHTLRLRPREGHELRLESSKLDISPSAKLRWHRDVEGNSVAMAVFEDQTQALVITSEMVIQQYDQAPCDFLVADYAVDYPFSYPQEDQILLRPYMHPKSHVDSDILAAMVQKQWQPGESIQTFGLLLRINLAIHQALEYRRREEAGVQTAEQSLACGTGSCRDSAFLFIQVARSLGFAARFVSGYIHSQLTGNEPGSTHAWAEVFLPGAGWKGFDPTNNLIVGAEHIAVAVARSPDSVPPVSGSFHGVPGATMTVDVRVRELP